MPLIHGEGISRYLFYHLHGACFTSLSIYLSTAAIFAPGVVWINTLCDEFVHSFIRFFNIQSGVIKRDKIEFEG
jgi:hypothetical protein